MNPTDIDTILGSQSESDVDHKRGSSGRVKELLAACRRRFAQEARNKRYRRATNNRDVNVVGYTSDSQTSMGLSDGTKTDRSSSGYESRPPSAPILGQAFTSAVQGGAPAAPIGDNIQDKSCPEPKEDTRGGEPSAIDVLQTDYMDVLVYEGSDDLNYWDLPWFIYRKVSKVLVDLRFNSLFEIFKSFIYLIYYLCYKCCVYVYSGNELYTHVVADIGIDPDFDSLAYELGFRGTRKMLVYKNLYTSSLTTSFGRNMNTSANQSLLLRKWNERLGQRADELDPLIVSNTMIAVVNQVTVWNARTRGATRTTVAGIPTLTEK